MGFSIFRKKQKRPDNMLPSGWQFYSRPNNLEPPGTIFRIDANGTKYIVHRLQPEADKSPEPGSSKVEKIEAKVGILARLIGIESTNAKVSAGKVKTLEYEIEQPERISTSDSQIDKVLKPFLAEMEFKEKNNYYIIRESRSATAMKYRLSNEQMGEIGGETAVAEAANVKLDVSAKDSGFTELCLNFPERLGVMFLPEEIAAIKQGLASGETELGRIAVKGVLDWVEAEDE